MTYDHIKPTSHWSCEIPSFRRRGSAGRTNLKPIWGCICRAFPLARTRPRILRLDSARLYEHIATLKCFHRTLHSNVRSPSIDSCTAPTHVFPGRMFANIIKQKDPKHQVY